MTAPGPGLDTLERRVRRHFSRIVPFAWAALVWERLWPRLWLGLTILGLFLALALFDVLPLLPYWMHILSLVGFAAVILWTFYRGLHTFRMPSGQEIRMRIERDSRLPHHPLTVLEDDAISGSNDPAVMALWHEHKRRAALASDSLRVGLPSPGVSRFDPFGMRAAVVLLLVIAIAAGSGDAAQRLERSLLPEDTGFLLDTRVDIWVTPPTYTGYQPFHVSLNAAEARALARSEEESAEPLEVRTIPVGSTLLSQVGSSETPVLSLPNRVLDFDPILSSETGNGVSGDGYRLQTTIGTDDILDGVGRISVKVDELDIVSLPVRIVGDAIPRIDYTQPPGNAGRGRLNISFIAEDDFGLGTATLVIRNSEISPETGQGNTVRLNLPLSNRVTSRSSARAAPIKLFAETLSIETSVTRDLSEHDWAGLPVQMWLEATDSLGQKGRSENFPMILPERFFNHPVARALSEFRKRLVSPKDDDIVDVIAGLDDVSSRPQHFHHDQVVYLVMRVARARLAHDNSSGAERAGVLKSIRKMMWKAALRIEDGEFALAGRELNDLQEELERALKEGDFSEEVENLLDSLDKALDRFLAALDDQLAEKGMDDLSDIPGLSYMQEEDLRQMIQDARELARTGSLAMAESTLAELRNLLDAIQSAMLSDQPMDQFAAIRELMQSLAGVSRDQQGLLDQTFQEMRKDRGGYGEGDILEQPLSGDPLSGDQMQGQQGTGGELPGQGPNGEPGNQLTSKQLAELQEEIRKQLSGLMIDLDLMIGMLPEGMLEAKKAMKSAVESLQSSDPAGAVGHQGSALEALRRSSEQIAEQIARQLRALPGNMPASSGTLPGSASDPFGRMGGGAIGSQMDSGSVKVPSEIEMQRVREIYEELRRRASNPDRPVVEREYIKRLLRQF